MDFSRLNRYMEQMPQRGFPACELSVCRGGEQVFRSCVGFSDAARTRPVTRKDLYWLFSASKVITCLAAMQLVESGRIALSDPVAKYIPEYAHLTIKAKDGTLSPAQNTMTIEHLFTMCGGMSYDIAHPIIKEAAATTPSTLDMVKAMAKMPLSFEPGTAFKYSLCHDVLAAIVEVVSGMRFSEYLQKNFFDPLGIVDMGFRPTEEQLSRFSTQYGYKNGTAKTTERPLGNNYRLSSDYDSGGAGLFGSVDEYMKIITVIACGGKTPDGRTLLRPETIEMLGENRLYGDVINSFFSTRLFGYGWGLCGRAHIDPVRSMALSPAGEFGWDGAAGAFVLIDPKNEISLFFGTHVFGCDYVYHSVHPTIRDMVYEALDI